MTEKRKAARLTTGGGQQDILKVTATTETISQSHVDCQLQNPDDIFIADYDAWLAAYCRRNHLAYRGQP